MRIGIIAPPWVPVPPPAYGGTEAVLATLASGLAAAGHDVVLFATGDSTCDVELRYAFETAAGVGAPAEVESAHVVAAYSDPAIRAADVIHDHTLSGPEHAIVLGHRNVVTTNHGPFEHALLALYQRVWRDVPVIAISHDQASGAEGVEVAAVIHHGIDVDAIAPGAGAGGYALFLGRMAADKGVDAACRAAHLAGVHLKIAAKMREPAEHAYFDERVRPLLYGDVEYVGEVGFDEKIELLRGARCLLNPLFWAEPFGMVMIESLACGTPVVATPWGSVREIVDEGITGFLAATDSAFAQALLQTSTLDREACRRAAEVRFSAQRMVADHLALYERVASAGAVVEQPLS